MCGRFALAVNAEDLIQHFELKTNVVMKPRYNIAPQETVPVLKNLGEIDFLTWGFLPFFKATKPNETGFINIRAETAHEKPSFRQSLLKRRCLVPVTGYYEWKTIGRAKQPYYIKRKTVGLFGLAGLWEGDSFGILTVASNALLLPIHHRMPVILPLESYAEWMSHKSSLETLKNLLTSSASESLEMYPVSPKMNNASFEDPICIQSLQ
jgi:putative SOS response-associated peptidase YedK